MISSVTVIAERSADADALATAFNILDPSYSIRLADSLPNVACMIVGAEGRISRSARWNCSRSAVASSGGNQRATELKRSSASVALVALNLERASAGR